MVSTVPPCAPSTNATTATAGDEIPAPTISPDKSLEGDYSAEVVQKKSGMENVSANKEFAVEGEKSSPTETFSADEENAAEGKISPGIGTGEPVQKEHSAEISVDKPKALEITGGSGIDRHAITPMSEEAPENADGMVVEAEIGADGDDSDAAKADVAKSNGGDAVAGTNVVVVPLEGLDPAPFALSPVRVRLWRVFFVCVF